MPFDVECIRRDRLAPELTERVKVYRGEMASSIWLHIETEGRAFAIQMSLDDASVLSAALCAAIEYGAPK